MQKLLNAQHYQARSISKNTSSAQIFEQIDNDNAQSTRDKFGAMGAAGFLKDFFSDYVSELSVAHTAYIADMLQRSAYQIGKAFAERKIIVPKGKRNEIAAIFISFAAELGYKPAVEWMELRGQSQASRESPPPSSRPGKP